MHDLIEMISMIGWFFIGLSIGHKFRENHYHTHNHIDNVDKIVVAEASIAQQQPTNAARN